MVFLDVAIGYALNRAKDATSVAPVVMLRSLLPAFFSPRLECVSSWLTFVGRRLMCRDGLGGQQGGVYVELGLTCADVREILSRGIDGKWADQLNQLALLVESAIRTLGGLLTKLSIRIIDEIQRHTVAERGKRNAISRRYHAKIKRRSPPGSWTSTTFFVSLACVLSLLQDDC